MTRDFDRKEKERIEYLQDQTSIRNQKEEIASLKEENSKLKKKIVRLQKKLGIVF